jgi:purine-binding chemotaxis protein CheW
MDYFFQQDQDTVIPQQELVKKYLTFILGDKTYAISVLKIREIIEFDTVTPIPKMPRFVAGAINLRGQIVPVVDLMEQLGIGNFTVTPRSCIVVVMVQYDGEEVATGIIVDSVSKVLDFEVTDIEDAPDFGGQINTDFIEGMGKFADDFTIILNIERLFTLEEMESLKELDLETGDLEDVLAEPDDEHAIAQASNTINATDDEPGDGRNEAQQ